MTNMKLFSNFENKRYVKPKHNNTFRESAGVAEIVTLSLLFVSSRDVRKHGTVQPRCPDCEVWVIAYISPYTGIEANRGKAETVPPPPATSLGSPARQHDGVRSRVRSLLWLRPHWRTIRNGTRALPCVRYTYIYESPIYRYTLYTRERVRRCALRVIVVAASIRASL